MLTPATACRTGLQADGQAERRPRGDSDRWTRRRPMSHYLSCDVVISFAAAAAADHTGYAIFTDCTAAGETNLIIGKARGEPVRSREDTSAMAVQGPDHGLIDLAHPIRRSRLVVICRSHQRHAE